MTLKKYFGKTIKFQEFVNLKDCIYLKYNWNNEQETKKIQDIKIYNSDLDHISGNVQGFKKVGPGKIYRKIIFTKGTGSGIIIGFTTRLEGIYSPSSGDSWNYDPGYLHRLKTFKFWKVATELNNIILVPKD